MPVWAKSKESRRTDMGTTELVPKIVEILAPEGTYEKRRIALRGEYAAIVVASKKLTVIETAEQAEEATQYGRTFQNGLKEMEAFFKTIKQQIDDIKKPVLQAEKDDTGPLNQEKLRLGGLLTAYQAAERRKREEEERLARIAAEKQAEEEAIQRAIELAAAGEEDAAEAVLEETIIAAPVVIAASAPKPVGSVARESFKAEVTNLMELVKAVAAGTVPLMAVVANEQFLNNQARTFKESLSYPGVKVKKSESTSFRS
jgi:hypothetical protein